MKRAGMQLPCVSPYVSTQNKTRRLMKIIPSILLAAVTLLSATIVSCSKDDDNAAYTVAGSYQGTYVSPTLGTREDASVITANDNGTYDISVTPVIPKGDSEYSPMVLKNVKLLETEEGYIFEAEEAGAKIVSYAASDTKHRNPNILEFTAHLNGTLNKTGALSFTLHLNHANTVLWDFEFAGKK